jgi:predicted component of type VI protein secretion system
MKGEQPHAGFPEAVYAQMAETLARAGHRVVVVEQVIVLPGAWKRVRMRLQQPNSLTPILHCHRRRRRQSN